MIERLDQLGAEADEETRALLDRAAEARIAARAAYQAGDTAEARARLQDARAATHQAVARLDPDLAACWQQQWGNGMGTGRRGMGRR